MRSTHETERLFCDQCDYQTPYMARLKAGFEKSLFPKDQVGGFLFKVSYVSLDFVFRETMNQYYFQIIHI